MDIKRNFTLILAIAIPVLMILFVAGSIYLPGFFIKPKNNFLYFLGDNYYGKQYSVQNGNLIESYVERPYSPQDINSKLYLYDIKKNESREISFQEAKNFNLDSNRISSDGFEVVNGSTESGFFPFFFYERTDYSTLYLRGHNISKKLNIDLNGSYYNNFHFLGWFK